MEELKKMETILAMIEHNARMEDEQMAALARIDAAEIAKIIAKCEKEQIVLGYNTVIDWEKIGRQLVTALIEVRVTPKRGEGFDHIAERLASFEEIDSLYLMSGGFDLALIIEGRTMREVAMFVAEKLAQMEGVTSTATHFVLKKYKDRGIIFKSNIKPDRREPYSV